MQFLRANDPRLREVTVTAVRMTPDLRVARVYVRTLGKAAHFLRGEVGRAVGLRVTPELRFEYDTLPDTAARVDALLRDGRDEDET